MKKVVYVERHNPCCGNGHPIGEYKSQEQLINDKDVIATVWLVDEDDTEAWGDDWNDAPSCCNSGIPYHGKGLTSIDIRLGDVWPEVK